MLNKGRQRCIEFSVLYDLSMMYLTALITEHQKGITCHVHLEGPSRAFSSIPDLNTSRHCNCALPLPYHRIFNISKSIVDLKNTVQELKSANCENLLTKMLMPLYNEVVRIRNWYDPVSG